MSDVTNLLILTQVSLEIAGLIARAVAAGRDVSDAELDAVFDRTRQADAYWAAVEAGLKEGAKP